jgi:hypothetical protein
VLPFATATAFAVPANDRARKLRVVKAEADAYVTAEEPNRNFGQAAVLRADGMPHATTYLRFRFEKRSRRPGSVTLLVYVHTGNRIVFDVRAVPQADWREDRVTYLNAPWPSRRYASSKPVRRGRWSAVDVTPLLAGGDETITLAITTRSRLGITFGSRESKHGPMLVVSPPRSSASPSGLGSPRATPAGTPRPASPAVLHRASPPSGGGGAGRR